jgi:hypothetical protein
MSLDPRTRDSIRETTELLASLKIDVKLALESLDYLKKEIRDIREKVTNKYSKKTE